MGCANSFVIALLTKINRLIIIRLFLQDIVNRIKLDLSDKRYRVILAENLLAAVSWSLAGSFEIFP